MVKFSAVVSIDWRARIWSALKGCTMFSVRSTVILLCWSRCTCHNSSKLCVYNNLGSYWQLYWIWRASLLVVQRMAISMSILLMIFPRVSWMGSASSLVASCLVLGNEVCIVLATSNRLQKTVLLWLV